MNSSSAKPYEWAYLSSVPQKYYAVYDEDLSPNRFYLSEANKWPDEIEQPIKTFDEEVLTPPYKFIFSVEVNADQLKKYDVLPETFGAPLVNDKVVKILQEICPDDFQAIDAEIKTSDGIVNDYKIINVLKIVDSIDVENSKYQIDEDIGIVDISDLVFVPGCMGNIHIARERQFHPLILASDIVRKAFKKHKIRGCVFYEDKEAFSYY